ncbi:hypothetical protein [Halarcobacter anaerophilus]|jgi:NADPH-dependent ferric siderophore reductase|uniref:Uncharacterized protein n=1 Tax=Halarcobacter anaerophilus TaxID=877500 RepID=A0A4Q0XWJ8_9BACT|nr:hypothetical protein [Halarcobacter anaerophilus]QDF28346.1 hypothetical protein AANAER_0855 [Halarcobacter anaerophilus]RXJ61990.1 hypothetical protein CRV06_11170 [Halarcobacter anaerophilus]
MAKIKIDLDEKNLPVILNILENLKTGLIKNIEVEKKEKIKPISSSLSSSNKKYLSKEQYKQKIQQNALNDEFLPKTTSKGRYLSKDEFKKKLRGM